MIYIVRHGQTDWNIEGRYQGRKDTELNNTGILQAINIKEELSDVDFDVVISSPLKRALDTARIITNNNKEIILDDRIIERCFGEFEGKLNSEVDQTVDLDSLDVGYGIETISELKDRAYDFCKDLENNYQNKNVLVTTHAAITLFMRCYFEGIPEKRNLDEYGIDNCEIVKYAN